MAATRFTIPFDTGGARVAKSLGANVRSLRVDVANASDVTTMFDAACVICSHGASMITGVAMEVDGGRCI